MSQVLDLVPIWTPILGLAVFFYVVLDGFDLGVGILFGLAPDSSSRNTIMNTIAPIWDGNETWLVLGGLGLLAAFPLAFAIIIPAVYFPILVMLLALVFRGVAFEVRFRDAENKTFWDHAFCYGSAIATFAQGMVLGTFIQGFQVSGRQFAGTSFDFLSPFAQSLLHRHRHQCLSDDRTAPFHAVASGGIRAHSGVPAGRYSRAAAGEPDVHRLVLLGVPRQGAQRHGLSGD